MQMKLRLFRLLLIVFFTVCGIVSLALLEIFGRDQALAPLPVPANADWVVRIDAASLIKEEALTVLFDARDEELLRLVRSLAEDRMESERDRKPLYIDLLSETTLFGLHRNGHSFVGITLKLQNAELFAENIPGYLDKGQSFAVGKGYGIVLFQTDKKTLSQKELATTAEETIRNAKMPAAASPVDKGWIKVHTRKAGKFATDLQASVSVERRQVSVKGQMNPTGGAIRLPAYTIKQKGIRFASAIVPDGAADSINKFMPDGGFRFPPLRSFSLDYSGIKIENTNSGMKQLPKVNAVICTERPYTVKEMIAQLKEEYRRPNNTIQIGSQAYYLRQLSADCIFIGIDTLSLKPAKGDEIAAIEGDLSSLVYVEADRLILMGMNMVVPQMAAFGRFAASTERTDLKVTRTGDIYRISGKLLFRKGKNPMAEMTRLLLGLEALY
jgi:hypothetical protein